MTHISSLNVLSIVFFMYMHMGVFCTFLLSQGLTYCVVPHDLKFLGSSNSPISVSQVMGLSLYMTLPSAIALPLPLPTSSSSSSSSFLLLLHPSFLLSLPHHNHLLELILHK